MPPQLPRVGSETALRGHLLFFNMLSSDRSRQFQSSEFNLGVLLSFLIRFSQLQYTIITMLLLFFKKNWYLPINPILLHFNFYILLIDSI